MPSLKDATRPRDTSKMTLITPPAQPPYPPINQRNSSGYDGTRIGPSPGPLGTETDRVGQINRGGVNAPILRMSPLPAVSSLASGAQAQSHAQIAVAPVAVTAAAAQTTANTAQTTANTASTMATTAQSTATTAQTSANAAASYRPLTNPLIATDAGSNATITVAAFTMRVAGHADISVSGGSLSGLSYGTLYYIYYADPTFAGGAVTYQYSTTKTDALSSGIQFFVGSILTPIATAPNTIGNNDGGTGAQFGFNFLLYASTASQSGSGAWTNFKNAYDGNPTTYCATSLGSSTGETLITSGFGNPALNPTTITLNVRTAVPSNTNGGTSTLSYSVDGGRSFTVIYTTTGTRALTTDTVSLSSSQNLGLVQVKFVGAATVSANLMTLNFYESWISVQG